MVVSGDNPRKRGQEGWEHRASTEGRGIKSMGLREQERQSDAVEKGSGTMPSRT